MTDNNTKETFSRVELDPTEFYEDCPTKNAPERRLLSGILERAITDVTGNDQRLVDEALDWINEEFVEFKPEPFSFQFVCMALDLDYYIMKDKILALRVKADKVKS